jgi:autotransporter translocation and assembly factor TamB
VLFNGVQLTGPDASQLDAGGRVGFDRKVAIHVALRAFPIHRLPGLAQTGLPIAGLVAGELRLAGGPGIPAISGQLTFAPVTFQGRQVGGGTVTVSPAARRDSRARPASTASTPRAS